MRHLLHWAGIAYLALNAVVLFWAIFVRPRVERAAARDTMLTWLFEEKRNGR